jgi:hypothetical protein
MPMCDGSLHRDDLLGCYCKRPTLRHRLRRRSRLRKRLKALEAAVKSLGEKLDTLLARGVR